MKVLEQALVTIVSQRSAAIEGRERALTEAGAKVTTIAPNARAAAFELATDVIVIGDVGELSASAIAAEFANDERTSRLPLIALTASIEADSKALTLVHPKASDEVVVSAVNARIEPSRHVADAFVRNRSLQAEIMLRMEREDEMRHQTQTLFHDVRGLLDVIASASGALKDVPLSDAQRASLEKIRSACSDAAHVIDHSQNPTRRTAPPPGAPPSTRASSVPPEPEGSPRRVRRSLSNLGDLVGSVVHMLGDAAREREQALTYDEEERCAIWGDAMQIKQIVTNLLVNAIQFTPKGGKISVRVRGGAAGSGVGVSARRRAEIVIADSGPGVPSGERERILTRSGRSDRSTGRAGIGLAVVRELAAIHGGVVTIDDTPGGGATFIVSLPHDRRARNSRGLLVVRDEPSANAVIEALSSSDSEARSSAGVAESLAACHAVVVLPKDEARVAAFEVALDRIRASQT